MGKIEKVKTHLKENYKTYLIVAGGMVASAVVTVLTMNALSRDSDDDIFADELFIVKPSIRTDQGVAINSPVTNHMVTNIVSKGHPGTMTEHLESGIVYPSIGEAARQLGLHKSAISKQLHGDLDDVDGNHFVDRGRAA